MKKVDKDMTIMDALKLDNGVAEIFMRHGLHCLGCPGATSESIADAGTVHNINVDKLVEELNDFLNKQN